MVSVMMYFIAGIVSGLLCFKCYLVGYGKGIKNPFANLFFWSALFVSLAFLKSAAGIPIYISLNNNELLFWNDFIGRMLFYTAAVFSVRIPLYRLYPKSKKTIDDNFFLFVRRNRSRSSGLSVF